MRYTWNVGAICEMEGHHSLFWMILVLKCVKYYSQQVWRCSENHFCDEKELEIITLEEELCGRLEEPCGKHFLQ